MNISELVAKKLGIAEKQVVETIKMRDEGATVPFIARYRKEKTGGLDETKLRELIETYDQFVKLEQRKSFILKKLEEMGKLNLDLERSIKNCETIHDLEAIYSPYKSKRKTRAEVARQKGLEPLAMAIIEEDLSENNVKSKLNSLRIDFEEGIQGIVDIIAEKISLNKQIRDTSYRLGIKRGRITTKIVDPSKRKAKKGYEGQELEETDLSKEERHFDISRLKPHQILALKRAELRGQVTLSWEFPKTLIFKETVKIFNIKRRKDEFRDQIIMQATEESYKRLLKPSIQRKIYGELLEKAEKQSIKVFEKNLRNLLLQPPLKGMVIMGIDPGIRTGSKIAIINEIGQVLHTGIMKQDHKEELVKSLISKYAVSKIAIGNGTGFREVEKIVAKAIDGTKCEYTIVSEAGASVYSASDIAREEFPDLDVSLRGAISIARRLQDPMAELIKIDPKSLGVGQYQYDVDQKKLEETLKSVLEEVVSFVGVDLNTGSIQILSYIPGLSETKAKEIWNYRSRNGQFLSRQELLKVKGIGSKSFEQAVGFLRVYDGDNPLDETAVHPEAYQIVEDTLKSMNLTIDDLKKRPTVVIDSLRSADVFQLSKIFDVSPLQMEQIIDSLVSINLDPRGLIDTTVFRKDIVSLENIKEGMILQGIVRNVTDFGAFIDIGLKNDILVHISELANQYVTHPTEIVSYGDVVEVKILKIEGNRVSGSMKDL